MSLYHRDVAVDRVMVWADTQMPLAPAETFLLKAREEVQEFLDDPSPEEAADVVICLTLWLHRQGLDIRDAVHHKIAINEQRTWERQPDGTYKHTSDPRDKR